MSSKAQAIRALDVIAIGPAMIWGAVVANRHAKTNGAKILAAFLGVTGVATIAYNGINYVVGERIKRDLAKDGYAIADFEGEIFRIERVNAPSSRAPAPIEATGFSL